MASGADWKGTIAIIGMLYKIVPFVVWFGCYSAHIGRVRSRRWRICIRPGYRRSATGRI